MPGPIESLRQQIATHGPRQQTARETAPLSGMRDHQRVTLVHDVLSQITDGAEEIGMAASHRGLDQKTLATRKIRKGPPIQLASLTRIDELYDKLPDMPSREKLQQLLSLIGPHGRVQFDC